MKNIHLIIFLDSCHFPVYYASIFLRHTPHKLIQEIRNMYRKERMRKKSAKEKNDKKKK